MKRWRAFPEPAHVALQLVDGVEPPLLDEALGEAEGEGGVVSPLAGLEVERPAADHAGDGRERSGRPELQRRAEGVAHGQAEEATAVMAEGVHGGRWVPGGRGVVILGKGRFGGGLLARCFQPRVFCSAQEEFSTRDDPVACRREIKIDVQDIPVKPYG